MQTISSQRYIENEIVDQKIKNMDFEVMVTPVFELYGDEYRVVIDGHHSYHAAIKSGNKPEFIEATEQDSDNIAILKNDPEMFLEMTYIDSDYYDIETDIDIW